MTRTGQISRDDVSTGALRLPPPTPPHVVRLTLPVQPAPAHAPCQLEYPPATPSVHPTDYSSSSDSQRESCFSAKCHFPDVFGIFHFSQSLKNQPSQACFGVPRVPVLSAHLGPENSCKKPKTTPLLASSSSHFRKYCCSTSTAFLLAAVGPLERLATMPI